MSQVGNFSLSQKEASIGLIVYSSKHEQSELKSLGAWDLQGLQGKHALPFLELDDAELHGFEGLDVGFRSRRAIVFHASQRRIVRLLHRVAH